MKKIINTFLLLILAGSIPLFATNINVKPIPSYNVPINGQQSFAEMTGTINPSGAKGKRTMAVRATTSYTNAPSSGPIQIYAVNITTKTIIGPYYANPGDITFIPIDDNDWGVNVTSQMMITVSVWIIDGPAPGFTGASDGNNTMNNQTMNPWAESVVSTLLS